MKIYKVEDTLLNKKFHQQTYIYCLLKKKRLSRFLIPHIISRVLYFFNIISKVKYFKSYWEFYDFIEQSEINLQELANKVNKKNYKLYDDEGIYFSYAPQKFINNMLVYENIVNLEDLCDDPDAELIYLSENKYSDFECVEIYDKNIRKNAKKNYFFIKGELVEKNRNLTKKLLLKQIGLLAVLSFFITLFVLILTPLDGNLIFPLITNGLVIALNWLPVFSFMLILYGLSNSIFMSYVISTILFITLALINRFKMSFRDDPFIFLDIKYAKEAAQMTNNYSLFIDKVMIFAFILIVIVMVWLYLKKSRKLNTLLLRVLFVFVPIICFTSLYDTVYLNDDIYDLMWNSDFGNVWKSGNQYIARGVTYSFLRTYGDSTISEPDDYSEVEVETILTEYETISMEENQKVNIIGIMLEAYNDFTSLEMTAEIDETPYQYFHEIQRNSYSGKLYTNIFAGGTIATERAFLTGFSSLGDFRTQTNSYVSYFKEQGYFTEAMHPCYGWFYNRKNVNSFALGFDNFDYQENKYELLIEDNGFNETFYEFLMDNDFFDQIIQGYENNLERNKPYFNFSVTYQNHGPYSTEKNWENEYLKWDASYNEADYNMINNYLSYIEKTDKALKKLYDYINEQEEPIVLIFFGDHNPYLGEGNSGYNLLGVDLDLGSVEGAENYYVTPYVITANKAAKRSLNSEFYGEGNTISPMFLMNEFFEVANLNIGSAYSQYLTDLKKEIDVINPIFIKEKGEYISQSHYDSEVLSNFYNIEYYEQYHN